MAYNSLKRIFGETKLELKLLFLFGVGLLVIIATAFWWYGSNTAKLVYEQNRNTAQLVLQEHMVATHLGAFKIQLIRPGFIPASPEEVNRERQWIERQKKQFSKHRGRGGLDLVARESRTRAPRATRTKPKSARSFSATRPSLPSRTNPRRRNSKN